MIGAAAYIEYLAGNQAWLGFECGAESEAGGTLGERIPVHTRKGYAVTREVYMGKIHCTAIVLAAGQGKRMGTKVHKQYLLLGDRPGTLLFSESFRRFTAY